MIEDFDITTNEFSKVDELMTPFKFTQQIIDTTPLIAPCDRILPFMFRTSNATSGTVTVTMVDSDGAETSLSITVQTGVIDGKTYYWHRGECLYPFLTCGKYYLKIVDGANTYYSVPFVPECEIEDIPDGYRPMRDANGCVMRDADGDILYEWCQLPVNINYGYLYNWYAATDVRGIAPIGWHVPTNAEFATFIAFVGVTNANNLKETGVDYWAAPNSLATDLYGFKARGAGARYWVDGSFNSGTFECDIKEVIYLLKSDDLFLYHILYNNLDINGTPVAPNIGASIRCIRDTIDGWVSGEQVADYDGNIYDTVQVGTQVWMVQNLAVAHYNDGSIIPEVTDDGAWVALATGARCSYDNDESNAFTI